MSIHPRDLHWLAGLVEGEGCFGIQNTVPSLKISMTDRDVIERAATVLGPPRGRVRVDLARNPRRRAMYSVSVGGRYAAGWAMTLYPLLGQRRRARIREVLARWRSARPRKWRVAWAA